MHSLPKDFENTKDFAPLITTHIPSTTFTSKLKYLSHLILRYANEKSKSSLDTNLCLLNEINDKIIRYSNQTLSSIENSNITDCDVIPKDGVQKLSKISKSTPNSLEIYENHPKIFCSHLNPRITFSFDRSLMANSMLCCKLVSDYENYARQTQYFRYSFDIEKAMKRIKLLKGKLEISKKKTVALDSQILDAKKIQKQLRISLAKSKSKVLNSYKNAFAYFHSVKQYLFKTQPAWMHLWYESTKNQATMICLILFNSLRLRKLYDLESRIIHDHNEILSHKSVLRSRIHFWSTWVQRYKAEITFLKSRLSFLTALTQSQSLQFHSVDLCILKKKKHSKLFQIAEKLCNTLSGVTLKTLFPSYHQVVKNNNQILERMLHNEFQLETLLSNLRSTSPLIKQHATISKSYLRFLQISYPHLQSIILAVQNILLKYHPNAQFYDPLTIKWRLMYNFERLRFSDDDSTVSFPIQQKSMILSNNSTKSIHIKSKNVSKSSTNTLSDSFDLSDLEEEHNKSLEESFSVSSVSKNLSNSEDETESELTENSNILENLKAFDELPDPPLCSHRILRKVRSDQYFGKTTIMVPFRKKIVRETSSNDDFDDDSDDDSADDSNQDSETEENHSLDLVDESPSTFTTTQKNLNTTSITPIQLDKTQKSSDSAITSAPTVTPTATLPPNSNINDHQVVQSPPLNSNQFEFDLDGKVDATLISSENILRQSAKDLSFVLNLGEDVALKQSPELSSSKSLIPKQSIRVKSIYSSNTEIPTKDLPETFDSDSFVEPSCSNENSQSFLSKTNEVLFSSGSCDQLVDICSDLNIQEARSKSATKTDPLGIHARGHPSAKFMNHILSLAPIQFPQNVKDHILAAPIFTSSDVVNSTVDRNIDFESLFNEISSTLFFQLSSHLHILRSFYNSSFDSILKMRIKTRKIVEILDKNQPHFVHHTFLYCIYQLIVLQRDFYSLLYNTSLNIVENFDCTSIVFPSLMKKRIDYMKPVFSSFQNFAVFQTICRQLIKLHTIELVCPQILKELPKYQRFDRRNPNLTNHTIATNTQQSRDMIFQLLHPKPLILTQVESSSLKSSKKSSKLSKSSIKSVKTSFSSNKAAIMSNNHVPISSSLLRPRSSSKSSNFHKDSQKKTISTISLSSRNPTVQKSILPNCLNDRGKSPKSASTPSSTGIKPCNHSNKPQSSSSKRSSKCSIAEPQNGHISTQNHIKSPPKIGDHLSNDFKIQKHHQKISSLSVLSSNRPNHTHDSSKSPFNKLKGSKKQSKLAHLHVSALDSTNLLSRSFSRISLIGLDAIVEDQNAPQAPRKVPPYLNQIKQLRKPSPLGITAPAINYTDSSSDTSSGSIFGPNVLLVESKEDLLELHHSSRDDDS